MNLTNIKRRLVKLEKGEKLDELAVIIRTFGDGEYISAQTPDGKSSVDRLPGETEDDFEDRAIEVLKAIQRVSKNADRVLVVRMVRSGDA